MEIGWAFNPCGISPKPGHNAKMLLLGPVQGSGGPPNLRPTPNVAKLTQLLNFNQLIKDFLLDRPSNLGVLKKKIIIIFKIFTK